MKKVINIILAICVVGLAYILYGSIMGPIKFDREKDHRDALVINRLIDIRSAQVEYRGQNGGQYTASFDTLINFIKTGKLPVIKKVGELNENQMEAGWTEPAVLALYSDAKKAKNKKIADQKWQEAIDAGFVKKGADGQIEFLFSRDTVWVNLLDSIYPDNYNADSIRLVPFGNGAEFEMAVGCDTTKSGSYIYLFEAKTPYSVYLEGLDKQELFNLIQEKEQMGRYPGMKVGDAESGNNNAGNWE